MHCVGECKSLLSFLEKRILPQLSVGTVIVNTFKLFFFFTKAIVTTNVLFLRTPLSIHIHTHARHPNCCLCFFLVVEEKRKQWLRKASNISSVHLDFQSNSVREVFLKNCCDKTMSKNPSSCHCWETKLGFFGFGGIFLVNFAQQGPFCAFI